MPDWSKPIQISGLHGVSGNPEPNFSVPFVSTFLPASNSDDIQFHFGYRDAKGNILDSYWSERASDWTSQQVNNNGKTGGPSAVSGPFIGVFTDQQHFVYLDDQGNIWDSFYISHNNSWNLQQINKDGNQNWPTARIDYVSIWTSNNDTQQHFTYLGSDFAIYDAFWDGKKWSLQKINAGGNTGAPLAESTPFACVFGSQQHIGYSDRDGNLWDCWNDGSGNWTSQQINNKQSNDQAKTDLPPVTTQASPVIWVYGGQQHFTYLGRNLAIYDAFWDGHTWTGQQINRGNSVLDPNLTPKTNAPPAFRIPSIGVFGAQEHIVFRDSELILWDCWYDGAGNWSPVQINGPGGLNRNAVFAVTEPFVWLTISHIRGGITSDAPNVAFGDPDGIIWSVPL